MSAFVLNGEAALWGELTVPRVGVWHADVSIARPGDELALAGPVELSVGSTTWKGTVRRSGENKGTIVTRVVGGADGLSTPIAAKAYQGVPVRIPLEEILQEAGETLAPSTDPAILGTILYNWSRSAGTAGNALAALLQVAGATTWRILPDGTLWIGTDTWAPTSLDDHVYLSASPGPGFVEVFAGDPRVFPGETFRDRKVSAVSHRFSDRKLRTRIWFEDEDGAGELDRLKAGLAAFVRSQFPRLDHFAAYWCRAVSQNADGTLELVPDDARIASRSNVPIRYGVPGVKATVAPGARVLLEFAAGDPSKPFATVWESATPSEIIIGPGANQPVAVATALRTEIDAMWTFLAAHVHTSAAPGSPTSPPTTASEIVPVNTHAQTIASSIVKVST